MVTYIVGSNPTISFLYDDVAKLVKAVVVCKTPIVGSNPTIVLCTRSQVVKAVDCNSTIRAFKSFRVLLNIAQ